MKTKEEIRKELIKILEDTPMYMTRDIEEAIKTKKILEIAIKNPKKIADKILKLFSQQKQEIVEDVEKYAGKVFGFEIIILKDKYDKRYIAGFGDGKKYLKGEVFKLLVPNKTQLNNYENNKRYKEIIFRCDKSSMGKTKS